MFKVTKLMGILIVWKLEMCKLRTKLSVRDQYSETFEAVEIIILVC